MLRGTARGYGDGEIWSGTNRRPLSNIPTVCLCIDTFGQQTWPSQRCQKHPNMGQKCNKFPPIFILPFPLQSVWTLILLINSKPQPQPQTLSKCTQLIDNFNVQLVCYFAFDDFAARKLFWSTKLKRETELVGWFHPEEKGKWEWASKKIYLMVVQ